MTTNVWTNNIKTVMTSNIRPKNQRNIAKVNVATILRVLVTIGMKEESNVIYHLLYGRGLFQPPTMHGKYAEENQVWNH